MVGRILHVHGRSRCIGAGRVFCVDGATSELVVGDRCGGGLRLCRPRVGGGGALFVITIFRDDIGLKVVVGDGCASRFAIAGRS